MSSVQNTAPFGAGVITVPGIIDTGTFTSGTNSATCGSLACSSLSVSTGAVNGYVLTSNAGGGATWQSTGFPALTTYPTTASGPYAAPVNVNIMLTKNGPVVVGSVANIVGTQSAASIITIGSITLPSTFYLPNTSSYGSTGPHIQLSYTDGSLNSIGTGYLYAVGGTALQILIYPSSLGNFSGVGTLGIDNFTFSYVTN